MGRVGYREKDQNPKDLNLLIWFFRRAVNSATEIGKDQPLLVISELTQLFPRPTFASLPPCQMLTNESENQVTQRTLGCRHNTLTPTKKGSSWFIMAVSFDDPKLIKCSNEVKIYWVLLMGSIPKQGWEYTYNRPAKKMHQEKVTPAEVVISGHWQGLDPGP